MISSIIHIDHEYYEGAEPWPIEIEDHDGELHAVNLEPGQVIIIIYIFYYFILFFYFYLFLVSHYLKFFLLFYFKNNDIRNNYLMHVFHCTL